MPFELDHVFVFASRGAPEADRLVSLGLTEGSGNVHHGQGTANRRFFFRNAMLELIWVQDEREVQSAAIAPTGLSERAQFRRTGASPFGICLRTTETNGHTPASPFESWSYHPPYLPAGQEILVARTSLAEPLLFMAPVGHRSDASPPVRREPIEHANGLREISGVRVTLTGGTRLSLSLRVMEHLGIATFVQGREHLMELSFDKVVRGQSIDLRPELGLVLRW
jgi:Glyoxalase-like domain